MSDKLVAPRPVRARRQARYRRPCRVRRRMPRPQCTRTVRVDWIDIPNGCSEGSSSSGGSSNNAQCYQLQKMYFPKNPESQERRRGAGWVNIFEKEGTQEISVELSGLEPGSILMFRVKAKDRCGWGRYSQPSEPYIVDEEERKQQESFHRIDPNEIKVTPEKNMRRRNS